MKVNRVKPGRLFLIFCQVLALAALAFCVHRTYQIKDLIENPANLKRFKVLAVYCKATGASTMKIDSGGQPRIVSVRRKLCRSLTEGDSVQLYYNKSPDFFSNPIIMNTNELFMVC